MAQACFPAIPACESCPEGVRCPARCLSQSSLELDKESMEWKENMERCSQEDIDISLVINPHVMMLVELSDPDSSCLKLLFHSANAGKMITPVDHELEQDIAPRSLCLGKCKFQDFVDAFEAETKGIGCTMPLDIVAKNCSILVLSVLSQLELPARDKVDHVVKFAKEQLGGNHGIVDSLSASPNLGTLLGGMDKGLVGDQGLVDLMVDHHMASHHCVETST